MSDERLPYEGELIVLRREDLFMLLGEFALPPWKDVDGSLLGARIDCAALSAEIIRRVEDLAL